MPNFNSLRRLEVPFFERFLSRFYGRHYWPLFRKLACELVEVTLEAHLKPSSFIRLLAVGNLTVVEGRFPANCVLYGLKTFVAAAVLKGITCVVQCYNNKSNHRAGISLHQILATGPAMEKWIMFVLTHRANIQAERYFCWLFWSLHGRVFPEGCSCLRCHCWFQLYGKKIRKKTRRKAPNLNAIEVIVCFFFNASTIVRNLFSFDVL